MSHDCQGCSYLIRLIIAVYKVNKKSAQVNRFLEKGEWISGSWMVINDRFARVTGWVTDSSQMSLIWVTHCYIWVTHSYIWVTQCYIWVSIDSWRGLHEDGQVVHRGVSYGSHIVTYGSHNVTYGSQMIQAWLTWRWLADESQISHKWVIDESHIVTLLNTTVLTFSKFTNF